MDYAKIMVSREIERTIYETENKMTLTFNITKSMSRGPGAGRRSVVDDVYATRSDGM